MGLQGQSEQKLGEEDLLLAPWLCRDSDLAKAVLFHLQIQSPLGVHRATDSHPQLEGEG